MKILLAVDGSKASLEAVDCGTPAIGTRGMTELVK
jgi:nucleotide-binding universal stress UspA family protein